MLRYTENCRTYAYKKCFIHKSSLNIRCSMLTIISCTHNEKEYFNIEYCTEIEMYEYELKKSTTVLQTQLLWCGTIPI